MPPRSRQFDHPISGTYLDKQVARVLAALPLANAYDAAPLELVCAGFNMAMINITYTTGNPGAGDIGFRIEQSNDPTGTDWYAVASIDQTGIVANVDNLDLVQRSIRRYGAVGAAAEQILYALRIQRGVERIRIACMDTEAVNVGSAQIEVTFTMGG